MPIWLESPVIESLGCTVTLCYFKSVTLVTESESRGTGLTYLIHLTHPPPQAAPPSCRPPPGRCLIPQRSLVLISLASFMLRVILLSSVGSCVDIWRRCPISGIFSSYYFPPKHGSDHTLQNQWPGPRSALASGPEFRVIGLTNLQSPRSPTPLFLVSVP
jgi:hypothetical protein